MTLATTASSSTPPRRNARVRNSGSVTRSVIADYASLRAWRTASLGRRELALAHVRGERGQCGRSHPLNSRRRAEGCRPNSVQLPAQLGGEAPDIVKHRPRQRNLLLAGEAADFGLLAMQVAAIQPFRSHLRDGA